MDLKRRGAPALTASATLAGLKLRHPRVTRGPSGNRQIRGSVAIGRGRYHHRVVAHQQTLWCALTDRLVTVADETVIPIDPVWPLNVPVKSEPYSLCSQPGAGPGSSLAC